VTEPKPSDLRRQVLCLLTAAVLPAMATGWIHPKAPKWAWTAPEAAEVTLETVTGWKEPYLWLDARSADAFQTAHADGALPLNQADWDNLVPGLLAARRPGMRLVVYCESSRCDASQEIALRIRRELGLPDIYVLEGGWSALQKARQQRK
jgi:rhodanese-related sulfurtransferase